MPATTPIDKIRLPDGTLHDFSTTHMIYISDNAMGKLYVTWNVNDFSGYVTQIAGTTEDYLLNIHNAD